MQLRLKKPENQLPELHTSVIIRYRKKDWKEGDLPYELGSAIRTSQGWYINGFDDKLFHDYYEITGWTYYAYYYQKKQSNG